MTPQEVFDKVVLGLAAQGGPSRMKARGREFCAYRGDNGRKCAVGQLIDDDEYNEDMEGRTIGIIVSCSYNSETKHPKLNALFEEHELLLQSLQVAHDNDKGGTATVADVMATFFGVAQKHGLDGRVVNQFTRWEK